MQQEYPDPPGPSHSNMAVKRPCVNVPQRFQQQMARLKSAMVLDTRPAAVMQQAATWHLEAK